MFSCCFAAPVAAAAVAFAGHENEYWIDLLLAISVISFILLGKLLHFHFNSFKMHVPFDNAIALLKHTPTYQYWM